MYINYMEFMQQELNGVYTITFLADLNTISKLYDMYEGQGQKWIPNSTLDYSPTITKTNIIKKLIKQEARFMFGRTPEIKFMARDAQNEEACKELGQYVNDVLKANSFAKKILSAAKDCFIGKRVAIKLWGGPGEEIKVMFIPSLQFVYETDPDDIDKLQKIIFFYGVNDVMEKEKQKIWRQKFEMVEGKCIMNEGLYNGFGVCIEETCTDLDTGLDFIPAKVILNEGLTGDLNGESDVEDLIDDQILYNHLKSDDYDALKFNMFPQRVGKNVSANSFSKIKISPAALVDLQPEDDNFMPELGMLESSFSYHERYEAAINRIKNDMYDTLSVPNVGLEQLKGLMQSGKSMEALYWDLIGRCNEKFCDWKPALEFMAETIIAMANIYGLESLPVCDYELQTNVLFSVMRDEIEEKAADQQDVLAGTMAIRTYIKKWNISPNEEDELQRILEERQMFSQATDAFGFGANADINNPIGGADNNGGKSSENNPNNPEGDTRNPKDTGKGNEPGNPPPEDK